MEGEGADDIVCAWNGGNLSVLTFMARLLSLRERERESYRIGDRWLSRDMSCLSCCCWSRRAPWRREEGRVCDVFDVYSSVMSVMSTRV